MLIEHLISSARATDEFKEDVIRYAKGAVAERIHTARHSPRIKVLRLLAQLFAEEPGLKIERVSIDAWSGCSDFRGLLTVSTPDASKVFRFHWDCSWRAEQQGWFDAFNLPDQIRAAREFGWQCFSVWHEQPSDAGALSPNSSGQ